MKRIGAWLVQVIALLTLSLPFFCSLCPQSRESDVCAAIFYSGN